MMIILINIIFNYFIILSYALMFFVLKHFISFKMPHGGFKYFSHAK